MTAYSLIPTAEINTAAETPERNPYRIMEMGVDCGAVESWREILSAIDGAEHGDGAPSVWYETADLWLSRAEVADLAQAEGGEAVVVGGALPGTVRWIEDGTQRALVTCDGHADPLSVYEAACHQGADLDDATAVRVSDHWIVGVAPSDDREPA